MPDSQQRFERFHQTLRLTFEYQGETISLVGRSSVEMLLPSAVKTPIHQGQSGFWYELRDRQDRVLYQRAIHNPIRFEREIFPENPEEPIRRAKVANPRGVFDLLVPDVPEGEIVVLFSSPFEPERSAAPASELFRVSIKQQLKRGGN
jgi:hypothetical protein